MKSIMYHYVREYDVNTPEFVYLDVNNFEKQIDYFSDNFYILNKNEIFESITNNSPIKDGVILTFDDGLKDHYRYVYPLLKKRGVAGIFYVPTLPYFQNQLLDVHRVHFLLGRFGGAYIYEQAMRIVQPADILEEKSILFSENTYKKQNSDNKTISVKQLFNYLIKPEKKTEILTKLMEVCCIDEPSLSADFYLTKDEIFEMENNGMIIGSHSHSHTLLSNLSKEEQDIEIKSSITYLNGILKEKLRTFCYPYGGKLSYNESTLDILKKENIDFAFTVESRDIIESDLEEKYFIPRYDCNEFPYGKASGIK